LADRVADVRAAAARRLQSRLHDWAQDISNFQVSFPIRGFTAAAAATGYDHVIETLREWDSYAGPGTVESTRKRWKLHRDTVAVPRRIVFDTPATLAQFAGETETLARAVTRVNTLRRQWPQALMTPGVFHAVIDLDSDNWRLMFATLMWADEHDPSGLFARQLPVPGADTKWVQKHWPLIVRLSRCGARNNPEPLGDLRDIEPMTFVRLLDDNLRKQAGALGTFAAPPTELARLSITPDTVIICENLANGRAFTDRPGTAVLAGKGNDVVGYANLPWVRAAKVLYWGDIDTYGFLILDRLREYLSAESILMDVATLHRNRGAWVTETNPTNVQLTRLTDAEQDLYQSLIEHRHDDRVRLEQERIPWCDVETVLALG
jgi:hypothetical protein